MLTARRDFAARATILPLPRDIPLAALFFVLAAPLIHFRHSRKHSRVSGAHYYHTGPPCSGVLANKVTPFSFSFFLSPSLPPSRPFCFSFSLNAERVPLIRASRPRYANPGRGGGGTEGQRTTLCRQHSRIMQFSVVLIWLYKRVRAHTHFRRSCRTLMPLVSCLVLPETRRTIVPSSSNGGAFDCRDVAGRIANGPLPRMSLHWK